jgi:hypothetical protein
MIGSRSQFVRLSTAALAFAVAACSTDYGVQPYDPDPPSFKSAELALGNADYGPADWQASPNYVTSNRTPGDGKVKVIVIHTVQGSYSGCISWFKNPSAKVSAHYVVSKAGAVTQMVKEKDIGWHVGSENGYTIGIEHEGYVSDPTYVTPQMRAASVKLTCYLVKKWGLSPSKVHIKGHVELPNQTHTDPGQFWPWNKYIQEVADCVKGGSTPPPPCPNCDDKNACTTDTCVSGKCVHANADGIVCWDQDACTAGEKCSGGQCVGGKIVKDCNDDNPCTTDGCVNSNCTHANNNNACDDGNGCTSGDQCAGGSCKGGAAKNCNDNNVCTNDACSGGNCTHAANANACDDGNGCTVGDKCSGGSCKAGALKNCDDGNPCTSGEACSGGACKGGTTINCDDGNACTADSCSGGKCVHSPNAAPCDDGNGCTVGDMCAGGTCVGGPPSSCDDANPCTSDACVGGACAHQFTGGKCDDGDACTVDDACSAGNCQGDDKDCDDGLACTSDSCADGDCQHQGDTVPAQHVCIGQDVGETDPCGGAPKVVKKCAAGQACVGGACQVPGGEGESDAGAGDAAVDDTGSDPRAANSGGTGTSTGGSDAATNVGKGDTGTGRNDGKGANGSAGGLNAPNGNFNGVPAAAAPVTPASGCTSARTVDLGFALWVCALAVVALLVRRRRSENA